MTLQELHELTGKVLKERPELANAFFIDGTYGASPVIAYLGNNEVTIYGRLPIFKDNSKELIWQAN
jgi:hypothetical protein